MLEHLAGLLASHLVDARLRREAMEASPENELDGNWRLTYSRFFRVLWSVMAVFWTVVVVAGVAAAVIARLEWRVVVALLPFSLFAAFGLLSVRAAFRQEVEISHWGISEAWAGQTRSAFPWQSVRQVRFVSYLDAYRVTPEAGEPIQFSRHVRGLWRFKWLVLRYVPAEAVAPVRARLANHRLA